MSAVEEEHRRNLWLHLVSEHAGWFDPGATLDTLVESHRHEHDGPGTIRNHMRHGDWRWDPENLVRVLDEHYERIQSGKSGTAAEPEQSDQAEHTMFLAVTEESNGIWLECQGCEYRTNLGYDPSPADAISAEIGHRVQALKVEALKILTENKPGWADQVDWPALAKEIVEGDVEALRKRLPFWLRPGSKS